MLTDESIAACLLASIKNDGKVLRLVKSANLAGGADNISVILIHVQASTPVSFDSSKVSCSLNAPVYGLLRKMLGR